MKIINIIAIGSLAISAAVSANAQSSASQDENSAFVRGQLVANGYECGNISADAIEMTNDNPLTFEISCAANSDGSGAITKYFFQLGAEGVVINVIED